MSRAIALSLLLLACNGGKNPPNTAGDDAGEGDGETPELTAPGGTEHTPITGEEEAPEPPAEWDRESFGDPYWLSATPAPSVEGNVFRAVARHGGGCAEHEFTYEVTGMGRSMPPTALGALKHDGHGDKCRALLVTPIEIDLAEALAGKGCVGRVTIGAPPATAEGAVGGALIFELGPKIGCEELPQPPEAPE